MKPRSLLMLFAVVAVLGALIWFVERDLPSTDERADRARRVLPIEAETVTAIEIAAGGERLRLEKEGTAEGDEVGQWRLNGPLAAVADGAGVESLLEALTGLEKQRTIEDFDPRELGLAEPRAVVTVFSGESARALRVGAAVPASSNLIVGLSGDDEKAFVVADALWSDLVKPAGDWRSRQAFPASRAAIAEVRLRYGGEEVVLARGEEGFAVTAPYADEADRERVDSLLAAITGLEVEAFLDSPADLSAFGLESPEAMLTVRLDGRAEPISISIAAASGAESSPRRLAVDELVFEAESDLPELVARGAEEWRSGAWTRLEVYEIDALEIRGGQESLRLERSGGTWLREGAEIPYSAASDLLYALCDARAESVLGSPGPDAGSPRYEIVLTAGARVETLRLRPAAGGHVAEREGRDAALLLSAETVFDLEEKIAAARTAESLPASDDDAAAAADRAETAGAAGADPVS